MSKEPNKSREDVLAAREAKKLAKQKAKNKTADIQHNIVENKSNQASSEHIKEKCTNSKQNIKINKAELEKKPEKSPLKDKDEVDRATILNAPVNSITSKSDKEKPKITEKQALVEGDKKCNLAAIKQITNKSVSDTLDKIADAAKEVKELSARLDAIKVDIKTEPTQKVCNFLIIYLILIRILLHQMDLFKYTFFFLYITAFEIQMIIYIYYII